MHDHDVHIQLAARSPSGPKSGGVAQSAKPNSSSCPSDLQNQPADCIADANVVLDYYGVSPNFGMYVGVLVAYLAVLHILTYTALVIMTRKRTRGNA